MVVCVQLKRLVDLLGSPSQDSMDVKLLHVQLREQRQEMRQMQNQIMDMEEVRTFCPMRKGSSCWEACIVTHTLSPSGSVRTLRNKKSTRRACW